MHVIRVIPLHSLPRSVPQELDYFWNQELSAGAVVRISLGARTADAMVIFSRPMATDKVSLKRASFALKRISSVVHPEPQATASQLAMAEWLKTRYAAPAGACLKTALAGGRLRPAPAENPTITGSLPTTPRLILGPPHTALTQVRSALRTATARVLLVVPERFIAEHFATVLAAYHPVLVHGTLSAGAHVRAHEMIAKGARLVIGTRSALFAAYPRLSHIIVEDPLHEAYKSESAPRYAAPDVARTLGGLYGARLLFVSPAMSPTHAFLRSRKALAVQTTHTPWPEVRVLDSRTVRGVFSPELQDALDRTLADGGRILIYSARRAYTTLARCQRCAAVPTCPRCATPLRVHKHGTNDKDTMLVCYHCATFEGAPTRCTACGTGRLKAMGFAGSQKLATAVRTLADRRAIPDVSTHIIDSDLIRTASQERRIWEAVDAAAHPIVIASRMVLKHRYTRAFDLIVIPQADALSVHPDYRTEEQLIYQLEALAAFKPRTLYLQTWNPDGILARAPKRQWRTWTTEELSVRRTLGWPPYARIVKITAAHRDASQAYRQATDAVERLRQAARHLKLSRSVTFLGPSKGLVSRASGKHQQHLIIQSTLDDASLYRLLTYTPPTLVIDADPRSIA